MSNVIDFEMAAHVARLRRKYGYGISVDDMIVMELEEDMDKWLGEYAPEWSV